jgi:hypothetical protein
MSNNVNVLNTRRRLLAYLIGTESFPLPFFLTPSKDTKIRSKSWFPTTHREKASEDNWAFVPESI